MILPFFSYLFQPYQAIFIRQDHDLKYGHLQPWPAMLIRSRLENALIRMAVGKYFSSLSSTLFFDIFFVSSLRPRVSLRPACLLWLLFFQWSFIIIISQHNSFFGPGAHTFCGLLNLLRTVEGNAVQNQPTLYSTCFRTWESQLVSFSSRDFAGTHF